MDKGLVVAVYTYYCCGLLDESVTVYWDNVEYAAYETGTDYLVDRFEKMPIRELVEGCLINPWGD